jgi:hypothetical protein
MATHEVRVDWSKTLAEEPETGHNRWHPDIPPIVRCDPGDEVVLQTRDCLDGQLGPQATAETVGAANLNVVHPLTGPVYVNDAEPGDILEVEVLEVEPDRYGFTAQVPGFGFLRDEFPDPYIVHWTIGDITDTAGGLGKVAGDLRRPAGHPHPRAFLHGHHRPGARPGAAAGDHRPRAGGAGPRRLRAAARPDRRDPV